MLLNKLYISKILRNFKMPNSRNVDDQFPEMLMTKNTYGVQKSNPCVLALEASSQNRG